MTVHERKHRFENETIGLARRMKAARPDLPDVWLTEGPWPLVTLATERVEVRFKPSTNPDIAVTAVYSAHFESIIAEAEKTLRQAVA